ncbi:hypothetical protein EVAR_27297_1 [Eumeta japonica]|uniref:Uncharacterized protein n=1 Tax=Eumeta variegata TaxID=151549 RepID=A0A4C1UDS1_EUMVA|nr:hypothetical protein EVAR_27297_1 [Eumeta japonica]
MGTGNLGYTGLITRKIMTMSLSLPAYQGTHRSIVSTAMICCSEVECLLSIADRPDAYTSGNWGCASHERITQFATPAGLQNALKKNDSYRISVMNE